MKFNGWTICGPQFQTSSLQESKLEWAELRNKLRKMELIANSSSKHDLKLKMVFTIICSTYTR